MKNEIKKHIETLKASIEAFSAKKLAFDNGPIGNKMAAEKTAEDRAEEAALLAAGVAMFEASKVVASDLFAFSDRRNERLESCEHAETAVRLSRQIIKESQTVLIPMAEKLAANLETAIDAQDARLDADSWN
jgi:hypothetical protein